MSTNAWYIKERRHGVKEEVRRFFKEGFEENLRGRHLLDGVILYSISSEDNVLVASFQENEVKNAIWDCWNLKSPDLDGYNFNFIKSLGNTLKGDIMRFVEEFFAYGIILRECNSLFIVLIPKVENAQWLGDYRPISLVGCMHKIVAKLLANRTKKVLPRDLMKLKL